MDQTVRKFYPQNWQLGFHKERQAEPEEWVPANVPGAVQLDWAHSHDYAPYFYADHYLDYRWMEDVYWTYQSPLDFPTLEQGQRLFFVCGGVDYRFQAGLGEQILHDQEGMFTPFELELTDLAKPGNPLWVCIYPAPKSFTPDPDLEHDLLPRRQANHSCKPAVSYGWDFHPRLIPAGIWQETFLEVRPATFLAQASLEYRLNPTCDQAEISVAVQVDGASGGRLRWELLDPVGVTVQQLELAAQAGQTSLQARLEKPQLWWPHDQGQPALYTSRVLLLDSNGNPLDAKQQQIGFRRVRLVMNENAWRFPAIYPKPRSHAPMTLEINGRPIFAKGSNWVSPQIFPGLLNRQTYEIQLGLAKQANMNILRCWGGAPVMKESFFEIADELGIMLWQEFPLSCNDYPDDPAYLKVLDQESRSIILRLKPHPSVVLWCGGNELFNDWSGMDDQSLPLRLLDSNCYQLDPERPFIMTSPLNGAAHGSYGLIDWSTGKEAWALFQDSAYTAYCEFSSGSSLRPVEQLRTIIPEEALFPISRHPAWLAHNTHRHFHQQSVERYFGPSSSLEELVERSHFLHSQGIRGVFEEVRRQKMEASMAINWCLNEPWLNTAGSGNLITYLSTPLPVLAVVGEALRPRLASARIRKLQWKEGESFNPELWILSDAPRPTPAGRVEAWLKLGETEIFLLEWRYRELPPAKNLKGPVIQFTLPVLETERFQLILKVPENPQLNSIYTLLRGR